MTATRRGDQPTDRSRPRATARASAAVLNPILPVVSSGSGHIQIGTDQRWAIRLAGLSDEDTQAWLSGSPPLPVPSAISDAGVLLSGELTSGVLRDEARIASGMLLDSPSADGPLGDSRSANGQCTTSRRPGTSGHALITTSVPPNERLLAELSTGSSTACRRRSSARVGVLGLGRVGLGVATALAAAGIGEVWLADDGVVTPGDLGATGYRMTDTGRRRIDAAARVVHDGSPHTRIVTRSDRSPDVTVVIASYVVDPGLVMQVMAEGQPHIIVTIAEASASVGPAVIPGLTACAGCVDLLRESADSEWPQVATALATSAAEPQPVAALALVTAGLACAEALAMVDGRRPQTANGRWEIAAPAVVPLYRAVAPRHECGCFELPTGNGQR